MEQAQRKPNSVLFSLKELRAVERQRVEQEEQQRLQAEEQRLQDEEQRLQAARQQEEQAEEQRLAAQRQRREKEERQEREDLLRLEEAERRARVEAEMPLQLERQRQELALRDRRGRGASWLPVVVAVVVLGGVAGYLGLSLHEESARAEAVSGQLGQARDRAARLERTARQRLVQLRQDEARHARRVAVLKLALADARKPAAAPAVAPAAVVKRRGRGKGRRGTRKPPPSHFNKCLDSNDPLGCLDKGKPGSR